MEDIIELIPIDDRIKVSITTTKQELKKLKKKRSRQEAELADASQWEELSQQADTLLANPKINTKDLTEIILKSIHDNSEILIKLNPKCNSSRNAELLYKKARRGKRGFDICRSKVDASNIEIEAKQEFLDLLLDLKANGVEGREQLAENALLNVAVKKTDRVSSSKQPVRAHPFRHYSYNGYEIYAGKTSSDNDELSIKFAKPSDIWFHAVGYAGSHVIIKRGKNSPWPPDDIIKVAGGIAVFFSKAKNTSYAEVHITEARFVRKPKHSKPGLVYADRCKTIKVSPVDPQSLFRDD